MYTLSRTAERCRKCRDVDVCNNKRLEACALAEFPKQVIGSSSVTFNMQTIQNTITDDVINSTINNINKKIMKSLMVASCYFGGEK